MNLTLIFVFLFHVSPLAFTRAAPTQMPGEKPRLVKPKQRKITLQSVLLGTSFENSWSVSVTNACNIFDECLLRVLDYFEQSMYTLLRIKMRVTFLFHRRRIPSTTTILFQ